jgi:protein tyrosine kinase modulator
MLEKHSYQDQRPIEADSAQTLNPSYFLEVLKRRALHFAIPFVLVASVGLLVTAALPARYLSQGTILVEAQAIPTDFVRPTVAALANDRIQLIEQRIMTRDNLLGIAKKFNLTLGWQERASGTEIVDFIKARTLIAPSELKLNKMASQQGRKNAVAFAVGFEYENPQVATLVANELVTMILKEDVRLRTNDATETTRFLDKEVKRLEAQLSENDAQIAALKRQTGTSEVDDATDIARLKAELLFKSATYSENHPDIVALKRKIAALQKLSAPAKPKTGDQPPDASAAGNVIAPGLDTLETKRKSLKDELGKATEKLSAARLGESLERGQQSERLEVIEQPTPPAQPKSPNRPKLFAVVIALAVMLGGGAAGAAEMFDQSVRRSTDLYSLVDSHLVVAIPYISTRREMRKRKMVVIATCAILAVLMIAILVVLFFLLPPLDILFNKVMAAITR